MRGLTHACALGALGALAVGLGTVGLAAPAHAADEAAVSILHAVPGATVDVYANGKALLTNFTPGTLTDPVMLPAGSYDLKVTAAGAGASGAAVTEATATVTAGANITVVAHLTADGKPVLTPYVNDTSAVPAGQARLTVRHDAAAPAVDVRANGTPALSGLVNPKEATAVVAAGTIKADVVLAGTSTVVIGPADLPLKEGANTVVYAWGSAADKNLKLAVQTVTGMDSAPGGVNAGDGGQAAAALAAGSGPERGLLVGGAALVVGGLVLVSRRRVGRETS